MRRLLPRPRPPPRSCAHLLLQNERVHFCSCAWSSVCESRQNSFERQKHTMISNSLPNYTKQNASLSTLLPCGLRDTLEKRNRITHGHGEKGGATVTQLVGSPTSSSKIEVMAGASPGGHWTLNYDCHVVIGLSVIINTYLALAKWLVIQSFIHLLNTCTFVQHYFMPRTVLGMFLASLNMGWAKLNSW